MIVINGIRYSPEDAKRLGLLPAPPAPEPPAKRAPAPKNKARTVVPNKEA